MFEIDGSIEDDFLDLVDGAYSKDHFHRSAKKILGDDYRELGKQIVEESRPEMSEKFESYFE